MEKELTLEQATNTALILLFTGIAGFVTGDEKVKIAMLITFVVSVIVVAIITWKKGGTAS